jgi:cytochrome c biogenesis protein CcmG/thiol:disulfide interchange protein DsbE
LAWFAVVFAACLTAVGCGPAVGSKVGDRAADFSLTAADGTTLRLSDLKGKVVVLDFWATWCQPCEREIPGFVDLQTRYGTKGLVVVGVSVDDGWGPVRPFMVSHQMNYPVVLLEERSLLEAYGVDQGIPTTLVIGRDGVIRLRHLGYADSSMFAKAIEAAL